MLQLLDKYKWFILAGIIAICSVVFEYLSYKTEELCYKHPKIEYREIYKKIGNLKIDNAEKINIFPNGKIEAFGKGLSLSDNYAISSKTTETTTPIFRTRITLQALWSINDPQCIPSSFGVSYALLDPLNAILIYDYKRGNLYAGIGISF